MPNYPNNYLSNVVFQLNYNSLEILKSQIDDSFSQALERITGSTRKESKQAFISFTMKVGSENSGAGFNSQWIFKGSEIVIIVSHDSIKIIREKYTNYVDFHPKISEAYSALKTGYASIEISTVSMRYINNVSFPTGTTYDFSEYINESLLAPTMFFRDSESILRSLSLVIFKKNENTTKLTFGFNNRDFPNTITKREFLLDFECSRPINGDITIESILLEIRNRINELFEQCISSELRILMNRTDATR